MTFALKEFADLKSHFNDTVRLLLRGKDSIDKLDNPRKYELQYLSAVLNILEGRIQEAKPRSTKPYAEIFYGAMMVITQDIQDNLGMMEYKENSQLYNRLQDCMGITESNKPTPQQTVEYTKALNRFMSLIYVNNDSRNGLAKEHGLKNVDELAKLTLLGFQEEQKYQKALLETLPVDGKSKVNANDYRVTKDEVTPARITEPFKSFADLKVALHQLELDELEDKNAATIPLLAKRYPVRAAQLHFLKSLAESLTGIKSTGISETERTAILAGAMYLIRGQIAIEYKKEPLRTKSIEGSVIHDGLTKILGATDKSSEDAEVLISAANRYMHFMAIETVDAKDAIRAKNIFSDVAGFNLVPALTLLQQMIQTCRNTALHVCLTKLQEELEATQDNPKPGVALSVTRMFGAWFKQPAPEKDDADEEKVEEKKDEAVVGSSASLTS